MNALPRGESARWMQAFYEAIERFGPPATWNKREVSAWIEQRVTGKSGGSVRDGKAVGAGE